ncbi:hypothetical protein D1864_02685 [Oceanobacillus picturae]|nr:hypothetical protein D1864_02685 [Oceanobacillus picturae]
MTSNFLFFTTPLPHSMYKDVKLTRTLVSLIIVSIFAYYLQWFILIKWKNFLVQYNPFILLGNFY